MSRLTIGLTIGRGCGGACRVRTPKSGTAYTVRTHRIDDKCLEKLHTPAVIFKYYNLQRKTKLSIATNTVIVEIGG